MALPVFGEPQAVYEGSETAACLLPGSGLIVMFSMGAAYDGGSLVVRAESDGTFTTGDSQPWFNDEPGSGVSITDTMRMKDVAGCLGLDASTVVVWGQDMGDSETEYMLRAFAVDGDTLTLTPLWAIPDPASDGIGTYACALWGSKIVVLPQDNASGGTAYVVDPATQTATVIATINSASYGCVVHGDQAMFIRGMSAGWSPQVVALDSGIISSGPIIEGVDRVYGFPLDGALIDGTDQVLWRFAVNGTLISNNWYYNLRTAVVDFELNIGALTDPTGGDGRWVYTFYYNDFIYWHVTAGCVGVDRSTLIGYQELDNGGFQVAELEPDGSFTSTFVDPDGHIPVLPPQAAWMFTLGYRLILVLNVYDTVYLLAGVVETPDLAGAIGAGRRWFDFTGADGLRSHIRANVR